MLVIGVGVFKLDMVEFLVSLLYVCCIVVDDLVGVYYEVGDLIQVKVDWVNVVGIGDVLVGKMVVNMFDSVGVLLVFKIVGQVVWDLVVVCVMCIILGI